MHTTLNELHSSTPCALALHALCLSHLLTLCRVKIALLSGSGEGSRSSMVKSGVADDAIRMEIGARSSDGTIGSTSLGVAFGIGEPTR